MKRSLGILVFLAVLAAPPLLYLQELHLDVPYVPTKPEVVAKMLEMAHVGKSDVLYDLGCGDGRIVITAAKLYGTHGTGIDINPERINESRANAAKEGVTSLVKFMQQDLFQTDFHEATVVTLYLLSSVNLRLRPVLFAQLRPGTRVVSHDFSMDNWKPDDSTVVTTDGMTHDVYFWTIPANVSGSWGWTWPEGGRLDPCRFELEQHFQFLTGKLNIAGTDLPLIDATISGDKIGFSVDRPVGNKTERVVFAGTAVRDRMEGTMVIRGTGKAKPVEKPWKAERNPATTKRIDTDGPTGY
jgi:SAM-dependent methyltransferase